MTVSSTNRIAAFTGNGSASVFAFAFMVFAPTDVVVIEANIATGAERTMVLNTDHTVTLNANQASYPGGTVTLTAGALAAGYTMVITSGVSNTQGTDLTNSGGFYPEVITTALDRLTVLAQQLQDQVDLAIAIPIADPVGLTTELAPAIQRAGMFLTFDANGNVQTITSVASIVAAVASALAAAQAAQAAAGAAQTAATAAEASATAVAATIAEGIGYLETIATAGQTVFTAPLYRPGGNNLLVSAGGVLLTNGIDYTETNNQAITLTQAASAGEVYTFRALY